MHNRSRPIPISSPKSRTVSRPLHGRPNHGTVKPGTGRYGIVTSSPTAGRDFLQLKSMEDLPRLRCRLRAVGHGARKGPRRNPGISGSKGTRANQATTTGSSSRLSLGGLSAPSHANRQKLASPVRLPGAKCAWQDQRSLRLTGLDRQRFNVIAAGLVGVFIGIILAFLVQFLYPTGEWQTLWGKPTYVWNRVFRWVMTPASGLPGRDPTPVHASRMYVDGNVPKLAQAVASRATR